MYLPEAVLYCIHALKQSGHRAYAVGGCVRDACLGLTPHDYDLCTDASPQQMHQIFAHCQLVCSGEKHGTVGVIRDGNVYEITTFRTEGGYADGRHPDWVRFVSRVEDDLARRDFTVNAMAYNPDEGLIDPWGGRQDLENRVLRAVGDPATRFTEDALRILRGMRFAVRFGFTPDETTLQAMFDLAPHMENLARERVFDELCKLLPLVKAADLVRFAPVLTAAIPELAACVGFQQHNPHHAYDVFTHIAHVVEAAPPTLPLRWAALLHDLGKPACFTLDENGRGHFLGHAQVSADLADTVLLQLKAPTALRKQVVFLVMHHMLPPETDKRILRRRLGKYGEEAMQDLLALQRADFSAKGTGKEADDTPLEEMSAALTQVLVEAGCFRLKDLAVNGQILQQNGFAPGPAMGHCLQWLLRQVQEERLPNEQAALLQAALAWQSAPIQEDAL